MRYQSLPSKQHERTRRLMVTVELTFKASSLLAIFTQGMGEGDNPLPSHDFRYALSGHPKLWRELLIGLHTFN